MAKNCSNLWVRSRSLREYISGAPPTEAAALELLAAGVPERERQPLQDRRVTAVAAESGEQVPEWLRPHVHPH